MRMISKQLRDSAREEDCTLRLDGCMNDRDTVVLCHVPGTGMKGMGMKVPDLFTVYGCYHCHQIIDGQKPGEWGFRDIVRAMAETQMKFIEKGLLIVKGVQK